MSKREIFLDGGEISVIKALGLSSSEMQGEDLADRVAVDLTPAELIDTLKGLMSMGYVDADKNGFYNVKDMKEVHFRINSGWSKDLREAINPDRHQTSKSKRVRRE